MGNWGGFNGADMEGEGGRCLKRGIRQILGGGLVEGLSFKEEKNVLSKLCSTGSYCQIQLFESFS